MESAGATLLGTTDDELNETGEFHYRTPQYDIPITLDRNSNAEDVTQVMMCCSMAIKNAREEEKKFKEWLIGWIEAGNELTDMEGRRFYVGDATETKLRSHASPGMVLDTALELFEGDLDKTYQLLSSGAIKYGAAKKLLGIDFFNKFWKVIPTGRAIKKEYKKKR